MQCCHLNAHKIPHASVNPVSLQKLSNRVGSNTVLGKRGEGEAVPALFSAELDCGGSHSMSQLTDSLGLAGVTLILPWQKEVDKTLAI